MARKMHSVQTALLISNLLNWVERKHGETNQMLSAHSYFQKYLHKMGKTNSPVCIYNDKTLDDGEHTLFECERYALQQKVGIISSTNIIRGIQTWN